LEDCEPEAEKAVDAAGRHYDRVLGELDRARAELMRLGGSMRVEDVFTCPHCGAHKLEEVLVDVMQTSEVTSLELVDGMLACDYGAVTHDGGLVDHYRCVHCDKVIAGSEDELIEFLSKKVE
jgi:transcription elongation factor Elf1